MNTRDKLMFLNCVMAILMRSELEDQHEAVGKPARVKPKVGLPSERERHRLPEAKP